MAKTLEYAVHYDRAQITAGLIIDHDGESLKTTKNCTSDAVKAAADALNDAICAELGCVRTPLPVAAAPVVEPVVEPVAEEAA